MCAMPWEGGNLAINLGTLANVNSELRKLSVFKSESIRSSFSLKSPTRFGTKPKSGKGPSTQFRRAMRMLFEQAVSAWQRGKIDECVLDAGWRGLQRYARWKFRDQKDEVLDPIRRAMAAKDECVFIPYGRGEIDLAASPLREKHEPLRMEFRGFEEFDNLRKEAEGDADLCTSIFGAHRSEEIFSISTMTAPYRRMGLGVCNQFKRELTGATYRTPHGQISTINDISALYDYLNRDEGLLFGVSQVANQGGMLFPLQFVTSGPRLWYGGQQFSPKQVGRIVFDIYNSGPMIKVSLWAKLKPEEVGTWILGQPLPNVDVGAIFFGLQAMEFSSTVDVRRAAGSQILVELTEAKLITETNPVWDVDVELPV